MVPGICGVLRSLTLLHTISRWTERLRCDKYENDNHWVSKERRMDGGDSPDARSEGAQVLTMSRDTAHQVRPISFK